MAVTPLETQKVKRMNLVARTPSPTKPADVLEIDSGLSLEHFVRRSDMVRGRSTHLECQMHPGDADRDEGTLHQGESQQQNHFQGSYHKLVG